MYSNNQYQVIDTHCSDNDICCTIWFQELSIHITQTASQWEILFPLSPKIKLYILLDNGNLHYNDHSLYMYINHFICVCSLLQLHL